MSDRELQVDRVRLRRARNHVFYGNARVLGRAVSEQDDAVTREAACGTIRSFVSCQRIEAAVECVTQLLEAAAGGAARIPGRRAIRIPAVQEHRFAGETRPLAVREPVAGALKTVVRAAGYRPQSIVTKQARRKCAHTVLNIRFRVHAGLRKTALPVVTRPGKQIEAQAPERRSEE